MSAHDEKLRGLFSAMASEDARSAPLFARVARAKPPRERAAWPIWALAGTAAAAIAFFAMPTQFAAEDPADSWAKLTEWTAASDELLTAGAVPFEAASATDTWMETDDTSQANNL